MAEKKSGRGRKASEGSKEISGKQQDQVLSGAQDAPKIGKIAGPKRGLGGQRAKNGKDQKKEEKAQKAEQKQQKRPGKANRGQSDQAAQAARKAESGRGRQAKGKKQTLGTAPIAAAQQAKAAKQAAKEQAAAQPKTRGRKKSKKPAIKAYFLGGLNEKNITVYECQDDMVIVDCGMAFPDEDMLGVDLVIPDFTFIEKNRDKIRGMVITHGHEDHIGAVPYLLKKLNVPVYGTALTIGLIEGKLKEHGLTGSARLHVTPPGSHIKLGCMDVELIHVNHSIADAVALAIHSPAGVVVHTGDFKIDMTPAEGAMIDLTRFAELGKEGVLALLADSTNVERPGFTRTERSVGASFDALFRGCEERIIVTTFASNVDRIQQIIDVASRYGRKVAVTGRSMENIMKVSTELGYMNIPDGVLMDLNHIKSLPKNKVCIITTGSQGETMSALSRMAFSTHRQVDIQPGDRIIISASAIPGNENSIGNVINELYRKGAEVLNERERALHVSGHACQEELKIIHALVKPKYFIPVHGEQRMLQIHAKLACEVGMDPRNVIISDIGRVIEFTAKGCKLAGTVTAGKVFVDGSGVGDVGSVVLRDRRHLAEDGMVVVVAAMSGEDGALVSGPDIITRGFVYVKESEGLMEELRQVALDSILSVDNRYATDWSAIKQTIKGDLSNYLYKKTKRSPMILPVIMEV